MCAIVGCVNWGLRRKLTRDRLMRAAESMQHRGRDGTRVMFQPASGQRGAFGLGHCRLAVNGGPSAVQPIGNRCGDISIVVNGELYDPGDVLRRRLESQGHRFATSSDSELALHLYVQHGLEFVQYLRGEFAIVIHDARENRLLAVRDRFGIKPLLYTQRAGETWFASQACAFRAAGIELECDTESVWHVMSFQYTLPDRTLQRNVFQIPPGCLAIARDETVQIHRYWDLDYPPLDDRNPSACIGDADELAAALADRFDEAVRIRLRGDVPVVSHLSGGIDSCSVLDSAVRQGGVAAAFSIGFPGDADHDESKSAVDIAARLGVHFYGVDGSPRHLIDAIEASVTASEGWCVNGHLPAKYLLSRAISQAGYKVALTGEGADELLAGYAHLKIDHCRSVAPAAIDGILAQNRTSYGSMIPAAGGTIPTQAIRAVLGYVPTFLAAKASQGWMIRSHLQASFLAPFSGRDAMAEFVAAVFDPDQIDNRHVVHQSLYVWMKTALAQNILRTLGDGCESAHATEGRLPMLDHLLFQWVKQQPIGRLIRSQQSGESDLRRGKTTERFADKWLLRAAMRDRLPSRVVNRPKHPFDAPPLANSLFRCQRLMDFLQSRIDDHPYFDAAKVRRTLSMMKDANQESKTATDPLWWMLLSSHSSLA
ncbi:Asparagine synthetase [glutamine-hydrolyzing] 1 [Stieleria maiorica]|uniref:asparagine synthase (glutamine-hydrolyzing) n=1 Tax=Stieleria maiorica TaxID=2795974 RepID=A0A5B9MH31_9BACT|nr:asparagine synthase (glutamine-hydrolyzing) [Stieleria maiorica]QEG00429.1 Asparagine synthetase [glutamine-hydrolyzing] 1 [Stieleria maiorica]